MDWRFLRTRLPPIASTRTRAGSRARADRGLVMAATVPAAVLHSGRCFSTTFRVPYSTSHRRSALDARRTRSSLCAVFSRLARICRCSRPNSVAWPSHLASCIAKVPVRSTAARSIVRHASTSRSASTTSTAAAASELSEPRRGREERHDAYEPRDSEAGGPSADRRSPFRPSSSTLRRRMSGTATHGRAVRTTVFFGGIFVLAPVDPTPSR